MYRAGVGRGVRRFQINRRIDEQQFCTNNTLVRTNKSKHPNLRNFFEFRCWCVGRVGRRNGATWRNFTARIMLGNVGGTALWRGIHVPFYLPFPPPYFLFFLFLPVVQNIQAPTPACRCRAAGGVRTVIKILCVRLGIGLIWCRAPSRTVDLRQFWS